MFGSLGQIVKRRTEASGVHEEQNEKEEGLDPLSYRLQHLSQRGTDNGSNGNEVDPFDIGCGDSCSDEAEDLEIGIVKMGAVDDFGWGASNNCIENDGVERYQQGDLVHGFGGQNQDTLQHQPVAVSTPKFGSSGSQSTQSHCPLSPNSCLNNDINDELAVVEQPIAQSNEVSSCSRSMSLTMEQSKHSAGKTTRRKTSISTLSTLSDDVKLSSTHPPPLLYKPKSTRFLASSNGGEPRDNNATNNSDFVEDSRGTSQAEEKEENCPRLEQLQQMTLEELKSELTTVQAQSKTNLESSWKAAERMRVQNSELEKKAEGLKTKLDTAFNTSPPVSRRHTDSVKYDNYNSDDDSDGIDRREGMQRQNHSDKCLTGARGSDVVASSMVHSNKQVSSENDTDDSDDVIEAFILDLESSPAPVQNQFRRSQGSNLSGSSSEFGFFYHDLSQSIVKGALPTDASNSRAETMESDRSGGLNAVQSGVYYPPPDRNGFYDRQHDDKITSMAIGNDKNNSEDDVSRKTGFKRSPTSDGEKSDDSRRSSLKRRGMLVRRPSFMGLFGLSDSLRTGSEESDEGLDNSNSLVPMVTNTDSMLAINVFQVEARSIMVEELENELKEKGGIVANLIDEIGHQKESFNNCEVEITRLRSKIDKDVKELTRSRSKLQQLVKELMDWDSSIECRLDKAEDNRQCLKQKETNLRALLKLKNSDDAQIRFELEQRRSKLKIEFNSFQERSVDKLSMVLDQWQGPNCVQNQSCRRLFRSLDMLAAKLQHLLRTSSRVTQFIAMKKHIEEHRERIIMNSFEMFSTETELRCILIRLKLRDGLQDRSIGSKGMFELTESLLKHVSQARDENARFVVAAVTKVDEFLSWWHYLLEENSTEEGCDESIGMIRLGSMLERILADVSEELAANLAKVDEEYTQHKDKLVSAGILGRQCSGEKLFETKECNNCQAELDCLNEQIYELETNLSERQRVKGKYSLNIDQLNREDQEGSKANLELLDHIQRQVRILGKKLTFDDDQIASLRKSLIERRESISHLENSKR